MPHLPDYRQRIQLALEYIGANLDRPLPLVEVARAAHLSEFHFHRIFTAFMRETVGQFITRKRLETAAQLLAYDDSRSVTDIALSCGYSSAANFSKAFSSFFGCSPSEVRQAAPGNNRKAGKLKSKYGKEFAPRDLYSAFDSQDEEERRRRLASVEEGLRIEDRAGFSVVCLSSDNGYDVDAVIETWNELGTRVRQLGWVGEAVDAYAILHDSPLLTATDRCRYDACIRVDGVRNVPAPLFRTEIPAGRYAVVKYSGPADRLGERYRDVYSLWLPSTSLTPDDFSPIDHYTSGMPDAERRVDMELLIKLRAVDGSG